MKMTFSTKYRSLVVKNNIPPVNPVIKPSIDHILVQQTLKLSMMDRIKPTGKTCNSCGK